MNPENLNKIEEIETASKIFSGNRAGKSPEYAGFKETKVVYELGAHYGYQLATEEWKQLHETNEACINKQLAEIKDLKAALNWVYTVTFCKGVFNDAGVTYWNQHIRHLIAPEETTCNYPTCGDCGECDQPKGDSKDE